MRSITEMRTSVLSGDRLWSEGSRQVKQVDGEKRYLVQSGELVHCDVCGWNRRESNR